MENVEQLSLLLKEHNQKDLGLSQNFHNKKLVHRTRDSKKFENC